ncbi:hypothetical protein [Pseudomonas antarctica]|nr:hypothetical protein [Pseudomonas antarctica]
MLGAWFFTEAVPMRYLKVVVQDRRQEGQADTVKLNFFQRDPDLPDELVHEAVALDRTADGAVDFQSTGDIDFDGATTLKDRRLLKNFANQALKLSWSNKGEVAARSIDLYVSRFNKAGMAVEVRTDFYQHKNSAGKDELVHSTTASDHNGAGILQPSGHDDQCELFDTVDEKAILALSKLYLEFNWH